MQRNLMIRVLALLLTAVLLLCAGCAGKQTPSGSAPDGDGTGLPAPVNEDVQIETPYCTLTIPFAFSELVAVEHTENEAGDSYVFSAQLEERSVEVYTIQFLKGDADQGELFGTISTKDGSVSVTYTAAEPDDTLQGEDLEAFYTAQETINDVFQSIQGASGFTAA